MDYIGKAVISKIDTEELRLAFEPRVRLYDNDNWCRLTYGVEETYTFKTHSTPTISVTYGVQRHFIAPRFDDIDLLNELSVQDRGVIGFFSVPCFRFDTNDFSKVTNLAGSLDCEVVVGQDIGQAVATLLDYVCEYTKSGK